METITPRFDWSMTFLAVAEYGSFSTAATHLGQSKAYVSKQVRQLERSLGVPLLFRTTRRMALTDPGRHYLAYCHQLRDTMEQATRAIGNLRLEVSGQVRLSAPISLGVAFVCDLLLAFRVRYPQIEIALDLSQQSRDLIGEGFDLALRAGELIDDQLVAYPLGVLQDWIVASPGFLTQHSMPLSPSDLLDQPCMINSHYFNGAQWLFIRAGHSECIEMRKDLCVNHYAAIRHFLLAGAGYAKVPDYLVAEDVKQGVLTRVLSDYTLPNTALYLVSPPQRPQPAKVRALIDFIREWFDQHPFVTVAPPTS